jgi:hypothetical protein
MMRIMKVGSMVTLATRRRVAIAVATMVMGIEGGSKE